MKTKMMIAIWLMVHSTAGHSLSPDSADPLLQEFLQNPVRSDALRLLEARRQGPISDIIHEFSKVENNHLRLQLLKIAVGSASSEEKQVFLKTLAESEEVTPIEKAYILFSDVLNEPTHEHIVAFLTGIRKQSLRDNIDLSFYGLAGVSALEQGVRFLENDENYFGYIVRVYYQAFPKEASDFFRQLLDKPLQNTHLTREESETLPYKLGVLGDFIDDEAKSKWIDAQLAQSRGADFLDFDSEKEEIISTLILSFSAAPSPGVMKEVVDFYLNDLTTTPTRPVEESDERWGIRRYRLLRFTMLATTLQHKSDDLAKAIESAVTDRTVWILDNNIPEFIDGMYRFYARMRLPVEAIHPIIVFGNAKQVRAGLEVARGFSTHVWSYEDKKTEEVLERIRVLSQFGNSKIPEDVRLEARATYLKIFPQDGSSSYSAMLSSLNSAQQETRERALQLISELDIQSDEIVETVARILVSDPSQEVRDAASDLIFKELTSGKTVYVNSKQIGFSLLKYLSLLEGESLQQTEGSLVIYFGTSNHTREVILAGLDAKSMAIKDFCLSEMENLIKRNLIQLMEDLNVLSKIDPKEFKISPSMTNTLNLTMAEIQPLIIAHYVNDGETYNDLLARPLRISRLLYLSIDSVKALKSFVLENENEGGDKAVVSKVAKEALDALKKALAE